MRAYTQPVVYWLLAIAGLVLALLGEGAADVVALLLLCIPLLAIARHVLRARATRS